MKLLFLIWELPQVLLGYLVVLFYTVLSKCKKVSYLADKDPLLKRHSFYAVKSNIFSGACLGSVIILNERYFYNEQYLLTTLKHEGGHGKQSLMLGPLYLIVVGIPSFVNNIRSRSNKDIHNIYYERFPEKWADKLGNVKR